MIQAASAMASIRPAAAVAVLVAAAVGSAVWPEIGVPVAFAAAGYAAIGLVSPGRIVRGRVLSPHAQHRAALLAAAALLAVVGTGAAAVHGIDLAKFLEQGLRDEIEAARRRGSLQLGQDFEECARFVCARASIVQLPSGHALGVARLSGFAWHDERVFGWPKPASDDTVAVGTSRAAITLSPRGGAP